MTFTFTNGLVSSVKNKGKQILQNALKTKTQKVAVKVAKPQTSLQKCHVACQPVQIPSRLHQIWRGLVPRVYYNSLAAQLGRQAAWKAGRKAPLLAFFGLVVSRNAEQNENELSFRIQNFIKTASPSSDETFWEGVQKLSLDNFEFGSRIGQGCNAAVYEARLRIVDELCTEMELADDNSSEISSLSDDSNQLSEVEPGDESVTVIENSETVNEITKIDVNNHSTLQDSGNNIDDDDKCNVDVNLMLINLETDKEITQPTNNIHFTLEDSVGIHGNSFFKDSDNESDTDSDITVISWESDEEFLREEGAPLVFLVDMITEFSTSTNESSDDEFEIIQDEMDDSLSDLQENLTTLTEMIHNFHRNNESLEGLDDKVKSEHAPSLEMGIKNLISSGSKELLYEQDIHEENVEIEEYQSINSSILQDDGRTRPKLKFDLAVKMMFNYDIESNATAILRSMEKETVPSRMSTICEGTDKWTNRKHERKKALPPHPNIVEMWGVFVDPVPTLPDGLTNYPAALPSRINPDGMGRNMTMFIVMKRYDMTLTEYLSLYNPELTFRERILLLAQLLEAIDHLNKHGIAHRDMKTDNILLDLSSDDVPHLVVSDFGCCLANPDYGLMLPYPTDEIDKGGNTALMAPEIVCTEPGPKVKLDYSKADLWSVGAIAYEILGADNPFYTSTQGRLHSNSYTEQELPPLPEGCPQALETCLLAMLSRNPKERPSAIEVLNIIYAFLWLPSDWLNTSTKVKVTRSEVIWWVVTMATDVILKQKFSKTDSVESAMKIMFLTNFKFRLFRKALEKFNINIKE